MTPDLPDHVVLFWAMLPMQSLFRLPCPGGCAMRCAAGMQPHVGGTANNPGACRCTVFFPILMRH